MVFTTMACHAQFPDQVKVEVRLIQRTVENCLTVFRGIPFAAPPIGPLRWKAPQPVEKWNAVKQVFHLLMEMRKKEEGCRHSLSILMKTHNTFHYNHGLPRPLFRKTYSRRSTNRLLIY